MNDEEEFFEALKNINTKDFLRSLENLSKKLYIEKNNLQIYCSESYFSGQTKQRLSIKYRGGKHKFYYFCIEYYQIKKRFFARYYSIIPITRIKGFEIKVFLNKLLELKKFDLEIYNILLELLFNNIKDKKR